MDGHSSQFGLIGLAVMGQNLALNIADHGYQISVYNRTYTKTLDFLNRNSYSSKLHGFESLKSFVGSLEKPRKFIIMLKAGGDTEAVIE
ncbi:MAG: NAD(P)-binding domain-containing protein, partial [Opitutae bacterium]